MWKFHCQVNGIVRQHISAFLAFPAFLAKSYYKKQHAQK
jgi:hypothetical protein